MEAPSLVVIQENRAPARRPLGPGPLVLGRDPEVDLPIDDTYLSRRHCQVSLHDQRVSVRDLGSYNGTYVNGQRIHEECYLAPGDVLKIGRTRVFVDFGGDEPGSSLRIYANDLPPEKGVRPVALEKAAALPEAYREVAGKVPFRPEVLVESAHLSSQTRVQRRVRPDDKTPVPLPAIEDSAVARASGSGHGRPRDGDGVRVLAQIARVLSNVEDVHDFLDYALSRTLELIPAERGIVMRLDPARRGLYAECVRSAVPGRDDQAARRLGISHTVAKKVVRERVSVLVNDAVLDKRFKDASSVQDLQIRSILCAPLWLGERISGLIYLDHMLHAYAFSEADRDLLVAIANLAALGVERLRD